ncbi:MAG: lysostaphin resistance A-like protein, partial [Promethearchaeota archaeon]
IKVYFMKKIRNPEIERGNDIFQFFVRELSYRKVLMLVILFPLLAFVEEFIYRSFLISIFTYYLNWSVITSIIFVSIIFGLVHYSTSKNWGHVFSTLISSLIYSFALIQLGILYPWLFHLSTNLFVLLFYYQQRKKIKKYLSEENRNRRPRSVV